MTKTENNKGVIKNYLKMLKLRNDKVTGIMKKLYEDRTFIKKERNKLIKEIEKNNAEGIKILNNIK